MHSWKCMFEYALCILNVAIRHIINDTHWIVLLIVCVYDEVEKKKARTSHTQHSARIFLMWFCRYKLFTVINIEITLRTRLFWCDLFRSKMCVALGTHTAIRGLLYQSLLLECQIPKKRSPCIKRIRVRLRSINKKTQEVWVSKKGSSPPAINQWANAKEVAKYGWVWTRMRQQTWLWRRHISHVRMGPTGSLCGHNIVIALRKTARLSSTLMSTLLSPSPVAGS